MAASDSDATPMAASEKAQVTRRPRQRVTKRSASSPANLDFKCHAVSPLLGIILYGPSLTRTENLWPLAHKLVQSVRKVE